MNRTDSEQAVSAARRYRKKNGGPEWSRKRRMHITDGIRERWHYWELENKVLNGKE